MEITLLTPATVSFDGVDLGRFDRETEVVFMLKPVYQSYTKTTTAHISNRRLVRKECSLELTAQWSKARYESFLDVVGNLAKSGTIVIDNAELNITIQNMQLEFESTQGFGAKQSIKCKFMCLDKISNETIIEK